MTAMNTKPANLKAPFPAFGGKSQVARVVWSRLGDVRNFIEPFCFSAAMLLLRPHEPKIETVNDLNAYVANFWRAIRHDPQAVADHADWPVNETDLHARHAWLVKSEQANKALQRVRDEPEFYDAKIAGWWCWGACMWIGSGWCEERGADSVQTGRLSANDQGVTSAAWQQRPQLEDSGGRGVLGVMNGDKRPQLCNGSTTYGQGVHKRPILTSDGGTGGKGVHQKPGQIVHLGDAGMSIHGRPQLADAYSRGRGIHGNDDLTDCARRGLWLADWFQRLSDRLRSVRVCCGHWQRVCDSDSTLTRLGLTGVFLDPPYRKRLHDGTENRSAHIYANDKAQDVEALCDEVQAWCLKWGGQRDIRIVLCGLEGEYPEIERAGWSKLAWKSRGGYGNRTKKGKDNAARERLWFSPHCLKGAKVETLFGTEEAA
jgi:site-specific DNA-adenine methylase